MADVVNFESLLTNYRIMKRTMANQSFVYIVQKANVNLAIGWEDHFNQSFSSVESASLAIENEINNQLSTMVVSTEAVPFVYSSQNTTTTSTVNQ